MNVERGIDGEKEINIFSEDHRERGSERKRRFEMHKIFCDSGVAEADNLPTIARHERPTACRAQV